MVRHPNTPIPTRKVLDTLLHTESTNWPEFLTQINNIVLTDNDLIIGLKAKEREIKWKGRFFALMSWSLREYFVFSEYLIKKKIIPLFKGLTMADDQTTLMGKMLSHTSGLGSSNYDNITIANHIDYEKWNNFQRREATSPVFTVIGQFFGLPNLFARTHEFFEKSLILSRPSRSNKGRRWGGRECGPGKDDVLEWTGRRTRRVETKRVECSQFIGNREGVTHS